jgi:hypothetical protein
MRYLESNDPEFLRFHRMRAALGATVLLFLVSGLVAVMVTSPPRAVQVSANCIPTEMAQVMSDAPSGIPGCVTPVDEALPQQATVGRHPAPSASATIDDPPIPTF